ncbi:cell surface immobilization antigen (macronuclear) [Tetrahymena thermophila SB210]|uniref:Cell surface immobilization antigen n=1 Tax=Tetrahymena thermophila (strain SB210) TaxID=312017 RepID=I7MLI9_TETTS|nr:cell surface immobilization antigen [Tetrahymena thermophila SB210]EAS02183.1 cell surface immobilization antigen [Tetrahymena thermophila SB210]|eukprot:XP_001022428.1 cell surface immobilization antigen [Tetrahymena thermophila SB210]
MSKLLLLLFTILQIIFATPTPGTAVTCVSQNGSTTCSNSCPAAPTGCQWIGASLTACQIQDCTQCSSSLVQFTDLYCQSCTSNKFANSVGNACVNPLNTCSSSRTVNSWTDADCAACYATGYIANGNKSACINCNASSGLTDIICGLCSTANSNSNKFANVGGTQCVNTALTCGASRTVNSWNNSDCQLCYGSSTFIAHSGNSSCVNCSSPSGLNDATCADCATANSTQNIYANNSGTKCVNSKATCGSSRTLNTWTTNDCVACYGTGYIASSNSSTCINCKASQALTDSICSACATANSNQNIYANSDGTACVNSTSTCGSNRTTNTWNDADCLACTPATPVAQKGGSICVSSFSSQLIYGSLILLISFLI